MKERGGRQAQNGIAAGRKGTGDWQAWDEDSTGRRSVGDRQARDGITQSDEHERMDADCGRGAESDDSERAPRA